MSKRTIIINTIAMYSRSLLCMGLALFSSRWVLSGLGASDYGLFTLVGALMIFVAFLNGVLSASAARFFAYSIGQGDVREVSAWFNVSLIVHLAVALILCLAGTVVGEFFLDRVIEIPDGKLDICRIVFRLSLLSTFFSMVSVPFLAMYTAKQHLSELAFFNVVNSLLLFSFALTLDRINCDRLIYYAAYVAGVNIFVQLCQCLRALLGFRECSVRFRGLDFVNKFSQLFGFSLWQLFGNLGYVLSHQGIAVLINRFFPLEVNASYGVSSQLSAQANSLANSMSSAFAPAITTAAGSKDKRSFFVLSMNSSRIGTLFSLLFSVPLILEMDYVLTLWLKEYPVYTDWLCRLILLAFIANRLSAGHSSAIAANGKIAVFQLVGGSSLILSLPLIWVFFHFGWSVLALGYVMIFMQLLLTVFRVTWAKHLIAIPVLPWVKQLLIPVAVFLALETGCGLLLQRFIEPSLIRCLLTGIICTLLLVGLSFRFCFDSGERSMIAGWLTKFLRKDRAETV